MVQRSVTRNDVAKHAHVSPAVVSYVVNNSHPVSQEKKDRVLQAIRDLHYIPNYAAKGLKSCKTYHIAYICDDVTNMHFSEMLQELERVSYKSGYFISLCKTRADDHYIDEVLGMHFDGIIISSMCLTSEQINRLSVVPTVLLVNRDDSAFDKKISRLLVDIYGGEISALRYLRDIGRKKIAFVDCVSALSIDKNFFDYRKKAYFDMTEEGQRIIISASDYDSLFHEVISLVKSDKKPDAFACHDDTHAMVVAGACARIGIQIPKDIAIVGYDGLRMNKYYPFPLSSVLIPNNVMAQKAMHILLSMIEGKGTFTDYIETSLLIRN